MPQNKSQIMHHTIQNKILIFKKCDSVFQIEVIPKKLFGTWKFGKIDDLVNFIIQKFARLKSKHFSQFFQ